MFRVSKFSCDNCSESFDSSKELEKHTSSLHQFRCAACRNLFSSLDDLVIHLVHHDDQTVEVDSNSDDDLTLQQLRKKQQERTLDMDNNEAFVFSCPLCPASYKIDDRLRRYMSYVHEARLFICRIQKCYKIFLSLDALNTHALNDHSDITTQCELCSKCFASSCLPRHKWDSHRKKRAVKTAKKKAYSKLKSSPPSTSLKPLPVPASTTTAYTCTMCTNKYTLFSQLSKHIRDNHSVGTQHICNVCAKIFSSKCLLLDHIKRVHDTTKEQHVCRHCAISYSSETALRMHLKDVHEEGRTEVCEKCSPTRKFSSSSSLKRHIQDIHSGGSQHFCEYCPKKYACWWSLVQHTRRVHEGSSLLCEFCLRGEGAVQGRNVIYSSQQELQRHISRQHPNKKENTSMKNSWKRFKSGGTVKREGVKDNSVVVEEEDKELVCSICSKQFTSRNELRTHEEDHEDDRFSCDLCFKAFLTEAKLARHMSKCSRNS